MFFECCIVANCSLGVFVGVRCIIAIRSPLVGRPLAAVGADLSRPHIRKHPQNGEQKCVCGDLNIRILRCGHPFAMKRIHVFNNGKIRIWQRKNTGTMNRPLRLAECKLGVLGVFVDILRSVSWEFRGWMWIFCGVFATCSFCVCYIFTEQKYGFCRVKVWFLACKKGVFTTQKVVF